MITVLYLLIAYIAIVMYFGFWFGLYQIRANTPARLNGFFYVLFNTVTMPIILPLGIITGLRRMIIGTVVLFEIEEAVEYREKRG